MTDQAAPAESATYSYKPSLMGAARQFTLAPDAMEWRAGFVSGRIPYGNVRRMRLTYRPITMQSYRFITEIWADAAPKLAIVSTSWKNLAEQERLDVAYVAFVGELHRRVAAAGGNVRFDQGASPVTYWFGLVVFVGVSFGLAFLIVRGLQAEAWSGAAFIGGFLALFLWQAGTYFRRNRPRIYRPDALPAEVMPKG